MTSPAPADAPARRQWGFFLLPIGIVLLSFPCSCLARWLAPVYPAPSRFGNHYAVTSTLTVTRDLALAAVVIASILAWRTRSAAAHPRNPRALPLLLGLAAALMVTLAFALVDVIRWRITKNEDDALLRHRALADAEVRYAFFNGGLPDQPACLLNPGRCLSTSKIPLAPFLADEFSPGGCYDAGPNCQMRGGYTYKWFAGPNADPQQIKRRGASASSVIAAAWIATPTVAPQTGSLVFCADSTGRVCWAPAEEGQLEARAGLCPPQCRSFQ